MKKVARSTRFFRHAVVATSLLIAVCSTSPTGSCCRVCQTGKACGDSCIERSKTCNKGPGCACNGDQPSFALAGSCEVTIPVLGDDS